MVRPFLRWMVSAHAPVRAGVSNNAKKVTRNRIKAHSNNGEPGNLRDEGTIHDSPPVGSNDLDVSLPTKSCRDEPSDGGEAGRESLSATGRGWTRSFARISGEGGVPEPGSDTDQPGRRHDWLHPRRNGPDHRRIF